jgi:carboxyl-terminal processing protease
VVGSASYGKGTVQRNIGLDKNTGFFMPTSELGSLKLTLQKFYRINGGSTQLNGVTPDIVLPDNFEFTKTREKYSPNALAWDEIPKAPFTKWPTGMEILQVQQVYKGKVASNEKFNLIRQNAQWLSKVNDEPVSLYLTEYQALQKKIRATVKKSDELQTLSTPMDVSFMGADQERINKMDKEKGDRFMNWLKGLKTDIYLYETSKIVGEMILKGKTASR